MAGLPSVDIHTHLAPALARDAAAVGVETSSEGLAIVDGRPVGPAKLYDATALVAWLDGVRVDRAWVSVPPPLFRQGHGERDTAAWAVAVNDGLSVRVAGSDRLAALAYLPLDQPQVALAELDRCADDRFVGWVAGAGGRSLPLDSPELTTLWDRIESVGRPIVLHPGTTPDRRLDQHYLANLLGNPVETTVAAAQLVFGDVLGTHPALRVALVHCGGAVPMVAGRWQRGVDTARPGVAPLTVGPAEAVRRFWVDALAHDPAAVELAAAVIGEDKLVLGSDWPFPMGLDDPWAGVAPLDPQTRRRVACDNAAMLGGGSR